MAVAVIGTGYVGLVTAACLAAVGHRITCVDRDRDRVAALARGEVPFHEDGLTALLAGGRVAATTDTASAVATAEVVLICVGTPDRDGAIDLTALEAAAAEVGRSLTGEFPVVAVKSTVVPGTTDTLVRRILEQESDRLAGRDFGLAMNPEFLSQGSAVADFMMPDRIVLGAFDQRTAAVMARLYRPFPAPLLTMGLREAEMVKYAANALQATLISFTNQFAALCEAIPRIDLARVMEAVHLDRMLDGPDGGRAGATRFLKGGIGFGGSCFPKDLAALSWWARRRGIELPLIDAAQAINTRRPTQVVELLAQALGGICQKRVAVLGLAFKPGTDDLRESPGLKLVGRLLARGVEVTAHDPLPEVRQRVRAMHRGAVLVTETAAQAVAGTDAAILATAWPDYRRHDLANGMRRPVLLDGRGVLDGLEMPDGVTLLRIGTYAPTTEEP
jgi:UDPglucose 6-dehydrogenase/GDP-mannose 6-dehydrogenase